MAAALSCTTTERRKTESRVEVGAAMENALFPVVSAPRLSLERRATVSIGCHHAGLDPDAR